MPPLFKPQAPALLPEKELTTLVENRSVYSLDHCELNIFETRQQSEKVQLCFSSLVVTTMFRGRKVMHLNGMKEFDYLPGESVIVPGNEAMVIDFPEASQQEPTQCLALAIDEEKIRQTLDLLNHQHARVERGDRWQLDTSQLHLRNSREIVTTIDRLVAVLREDNGAKDIFANFMLQELLIRLMQTQARDLLLQNSKALATSHRFACIIQYVRENLHRNITVEELSRIACMSKPSFFRSFKMELGVSPAAFIIRERVRRARELLSTASVSVSEAAFGAGFNDLSYFVQTFRKLEGMTPTAFKRAASFKQ